ncbi:MAG: hypothetical protein WCF65_00915 [Parachlamydiaceae bacterium]
MVSSASHTHADILGDFYKALESELSYVGGQDQDNLIAAFYETVRREKPSFSFPELELYLKMRKACKDTSKCIPQQKTISDLVKARLAKK